jgi:uncharacterized RDD family membrane protein YckC
MPNWEKAVKRPEFYRQAEEPAPSIAGRDWYYVRGGTRAGPLSMDAVRGLIASGQLSADDMVWSDGMRDWQPAGNVSTFFSQEPQIAQPVWPQQPYAASPGILNYHTPNRRVEYAGFWLRFCAAVVDGMIVGLANAAISSLIRMGAMSLDFEPVVDLLSIVVDWLYFALQESSTAQATLGKRMCRIKVTNLAGEPISFGRATGRYFGKYVSAIILGIGYFMAGFTQRKQALHDMMAGCLVVRKK